MKKKKWHRQKNIYIPVAIVLGVLGLRVSLATLLGVGIECELSADYYDGIEEELFSKK